MRATVRLKEGKTYRWGPYIFTPEVSEISDPGHINELLTVGQLDVRVIDETPKSDEAPAKPKAAAAAKGGKGKGKSEKPATDEDGGEGDGG